MRNFLIVIGLLLSTAYGDDGLETLKAGCKDPTSFGHQRPPNEVKVTCDDTRYMWKYSNDDSGTFKNEREMCSKAITDKPRLNSPRVCIPCDKMPTGYQCGSYHEVCQTVTMTYSVTCDQILAMETLGKFCLQMVDQEVAATEEKILEEKATGKVKKVCGIQDFINGKPIKN